MDWILLVKERIPKKLCFLASVGIFSRVGSIFGFSILEKITLHFLWDSGLMIMMIFILLPHLPQEIQGENHKKELPSSPCFSSCSSCSSSGIFLVLVLKICTRQEVKWFPVYGIFHIIIINLTNLTTVKNNS